MLDFLGDWLREKFGSTLPGWVVFVFSVLLSTLILLAIGLDAKTSSPTLSLLWFLALASELAKVILTAIIAGAVLKVMAVQGFFEDALTKIVFGERGLDMMSLERRLDVWKALTCRIHAPFLHEKRNQDELRHFYTMLMDAEARQIDYREKFYIENINRELTFYWLDKTKNVIMVDDYMDAILVPFDATKPISWMSRRHATADEQLDQYQVTDTVLSLEGEDVSQRKTELSEDKKTESIHHVLAGRSKYNIIKRRKQSWCVTLDPVLSITSTYVIVNGAFKITNKLGGAKISFTELGGTGPGASGLFRPVHGPNVLPFDEELRRAIHTVLLPRQGFQAIVMLEPQGVAGSRDDAQLG